MNIFKAKRYFEDHMFSRIGYKSFSGLSEGIDFDLRRITNTYSIDDLLNSVIGIGTTNRGQLEIAMDHEYICHSGACTNLHSKVCGHFYLGGHEVVVRRRRRSTIHLQKGSPIGHQSLVANGSYGSLGSFLIPRREGSNIRIVSNNHVLANSNQARLGDKIYESGSSPQLIGRLENFVHINPDGRNELDLAVGELNDGWSMTNPSFIQARVARLGEMVIKTGATTGTRYGNVISTDYTDIINYGRFTALFTNQIRISGMNGTSFSEPGDSGSLILATSDEAFIGLLFAGSGDHTIANTATAVNNQLREWKYFNK
jgi:hypothetical protein